MGDDRSGDGDETEPNRFECEGAPVVREETKFQILDEVEGEDEDLEEGGVGVEVGTRETFAGEIVFKFVEEMFIGEPLTMPSTNFFCGPIIDVGDAGVVGETGMFKEIGLILGPAHEDDAVSVPAFAEDMNGFGDGDGRVPGGTFPERVWDGFGHFYDGGVHIGGDDEVSAFFMPEVEDIRLIPCAVDAKAKMQSLRQRAVECAAETERMGVRRGIAFAKDGERNRVMKFGDGGEERIISADAFEICPGSLLFVRFNDGAVGIEGQFGEVHIRNQAANQRLIDPGEPMDGGGGELMEELTEGGIVWKRFDAEEFGQATVVADGADVVEARSTRQIEIDDTHDFFAGTISAFTFFERQRVVDAIEEAKGFGQPADERQSGKGCDGVFRRFDLKFVQVGKYHSNRLVSLFHPLGEIFPLVRTLILSGFPEGEARFFYA